MLKLTDCLCLGTAVHEEEFIGLRLLEEKIYLGKGAAPSYVDILLSGVSPLVLTNAVANGLNYLKLFGGTELVPETYLDTVRLDGGCERRNLPSEYTQVEYLESSGTQYIDTGVLLSNTDVFEITFQSLNTLGTPIAGAIGDGTSFTSTNNLSVTYTVNANLSAYSVYCDGDAGNADYSWNGGDRSDGLKHTIKYNGLNIAPTLDGVSMTQVSTHTLTKNNPTVTTWLFGRNNTSTGTLSQAGVRIYGFYIQGKGHFIPCRRNSDSVLGMYDTVTNTFLTNQGTGEFTAGADVTAPSPDTPMDIVCNNGVVKYSTNLFDGQWQVGIYSPNTGEYSATNNRICNVNIMKVSPSTNYTVSFPDFTIGVNFRWVFYKSDKTFASAITNGDTTITTPANAEYLNVYIATDLTTAQAPDMQIEKGDVATAYNSHIEGVYTDGTTETVTDSLGNTASAERLLAVGDYKDVQSVLDGAVTRNVGIKVLDGTENWTISGAGTASDPTRFTVSELIIFPDSNTIECLSTHYPFSGVAPTGAGITPDTFNIGIYNNIHYIRFAPTDITTVTGWINYLKAQYNSGQPVIVIYPLATATTEIVSGQFLSKSPVTQTAGSIDNLPIAITESSHTVPTPQQPLPINCNNGVVKYGQYGKNLFNPQNMPTFSGDLTYIVGGQPEPISDGFKVTLGRNTDTRYNYFVSLPVEAGYVYSCEAPSVGSLTIIDDKWAFVYSRQGNGGLTAGTVVEFHKVQLEQGSTATTYEPYHFGLHTDGTVETIKVTGKNLLNSADFIIGFGIKTDGTELPSGNSACTPYIKVKPNTKYTLSGVASLLGFYSYRGCEYDNSYTKTQNFGGTNTQYTTLTFTTSARTEYIRITLKCEADQDISQAMLEQDETATAYEPYYSGGSATAETLLKIGEYKDEQSVIDGTVTRNLKVLVLDGVTTGKKISNVWNSTYKRGNVTIPDFGGGDVPIADSLCSHFKYDSNVNGSPTEAGFCTRSTDKLILFSFLGLDNITSYQTANAWLADQYSAGTPVIILYPLATSTTETVTGQSLTVQQGTNIVTITQASIDNLTMELSYKAGAVVTVTEVENAQLSNSVEVTIQ